MVNWLAACPGFGDFQMTFVQHKFLQHCY